MKYTASEAGKKLSRLVKKACSGEEVVIARGKGFLVKLAPVRDCEVFSRAKKVRKPGRLKENRLRPGGL